MKVFPRPSKPHSSFYSCVALFQSLETLCVAWGWFDVGALRSCPFDATDETAAHGRPLLSGKRPASAQKQTLPSENARRLIQAQKANLPKIKSAVRERTHKKYKKQTDEHWAWYVWPTRKPGRSDPERTGITNLADAAFVLKGPTGTMWTQTLVELTRVLGAQRTKDVFPRADHGRIDNFVREWVRERSYDEVLTEFPNFRDAVSTFATEWANTY